MHKKKKCSFKFVSFHNHLHLFIVIYSYFQRDTTSYKTLPLQVADYSLICGNPYGLPSFTKSGP